VMAYTSYSPSLLFVAQIIPTYLIELSYIKIQLA